MPRRGTESVAELDGNPGREFWYLVLRMFPFLFFPFITLLAVMAGLVMPYFTGVYSR